MDLADQKGCLCGKILAHYNADVSKIEKPVGNLHGELVLFTLISQTHRIVSIGMLSTKQEENNLRYRDLRRAGNLSEAEQHN